jgi:hypothetical protein
MSIDAEFVTAIRDLAYEAKDVEIVEIDGRTYTTSNLKQVTPPTPSRFQLRTLVGVVTYITANPDSASAPIVHVVSPTEVDVYTGADTRTAQRAHLIEAKPRLDSFAFGSYLDIETFIIALQSRFVPHDDTAAILRLVGNLTDSTVKQYNDDGVTQGVTVKAGIARVEETPVPPRVRLAPYRAFPEIEQPTSEFVFRLRRDGDRPPRAALFEADGGAWAVEAIENIGAWLGKKLPTGTTILA